MRVLAKVYDPFSYPQSYLVDTHKCSDILRECVRWNGVYHIGRKGDSDAIFARKATAVADSVSVIWSDVK